MGIWEDKAEQAAERKARMLSFGPYARGLLVESKHGLFVVDPEDSSVTSWLLYHGTFGDGELELASSLVKPESDVLILGPHIGGIAVPLSKRCRHMDIVEANPDTQFLLNLNLLLNGCSNVVLHRVAASNSREPIEFFVNRENSGGSKRRPIYEHIHYVYDSPRTISVEAWPLDELLAGRSYDLIFVDIEGSEYFALQGMQNILSSANAMSIEFLPHHLIDVAGISASEFMDQIEPHFNWLYTPKYNNLVKGGEVRETVERYFKQGDGHDGLYFLKAVDRAWAEARRVEIPA